MTNKSNNGVSRRDVLKTGVGVAAGAAIVGAGVKLSPAQAAHHEAAEAAGWVKGNPTSKAPIPEIITGPVEVWKMAPVPEPVPFTEGYAETTPTKIWHWDTGGDGEVIVLCHPWSQSSECYKKFQMPVLARAGYRVIAWSQRGFYKTDKGPEDNMGSSAEDLDQLLGLLGVDKFHLVGCAAGGVSAIAYALYKPERLHSLVLSGTILLPDEQEYKDYRANLASAAPGEKANVPVEFGETGASFRAGNPEGLAAWIEMEHLAHPDGWFTAQPWGPVERNYETFSKMTVPTLLQAGDTDMGGPPAIMRMFGNHFPNHELRVIKEAGHNPYWEQPEAFNASILEWAGRNSPSNG